MKYQLGTWTFAGTLFYWISSSSTKDETCKMLDWCRTQWGPTDVGRTIDCEWVYTGAFCFKNEANRTAFLTTWMKN